MMWLLLAGLLLAGELRGVIAIKTTLARALELRHKLTVLRVQQQEYAAVQESKAQMALVQGVAEQLIDTTTQTTRETHQKIADVPFTVLESIPATRDAAKAARGVHDVTSTSVYAAVSLLNKGVGKGVRSFLQAELDNRSKDKKVENITPASSDKPGDKKP